MKNKIKYLLFFLINSLLITSNLYSSEIFNFNVTEIEITQNGNIFKGSKGGEALTDNGVSVIAENFEYNKILTLLTANTNVQLRDEVKNINITANKLFYFKNQEKIIGKGNVQLKDINKDIIIKADEILYLKNKGEIIAKGKVEFNDQKKNITINAVKVKYLKKDEKIITQGTTEAKIFSKYNFKSSNVIFLRNKMVLSSSNKTKVLDKNSTLYELNSFNFQIKNEFLKGSDVSIIQNINSPHEERDRLFFKSGFFDLKNRTFTASDTMIKLKKDSFDRTDNDPRIYGVSSKKEDEITSVKKAIFTSCKKTDNCPPWKLEASEIKHDKNKKQLIYDNSVLKVYNIPVFYFPKFFHPDPTVKRQSGFLQPRLNNSNLLGSSLSVPYFHVISENKDLTLNPVLFSNNTRMFQNEFRQENKNSSFMADFGIVNGFESTATQKKKNINHLFAKFTKKFNFYDFKKSDLNVFIERVSKDTYLKIFGDNLTDNYIKPKDYNNLHSGFDFFLEDENFALSGGADIYEDLTKNQSDRYQFVLPYYNFSKDLISNNLGSLDLDSTGNNTVDNTNNVKTKVINDFSFRFNEKIIENIGLKNNFNLYFKNLNSVGKNVTDYKSSPQIELQSLIELNTELPMYKVTTNNNQSLIPRMSIRINPGDMKNHSTAEREIDMDNIFDINRLGIDDSFESGNSLTLGVDFKNQSLSDDVNVFEFKLASVFRDKKEKNIPSQTSLDDKSSNIFGSIDYKLSNLINLDYNFALDDRLENFASNSIGLGVSLNNFVTNFNFIEKDTDQGNTNIFENTTEYSFNKQNSILFRTRKNREINLTEYYDLVYEYNNDCLTAGIRFSKTYYEDRELKPTENLMFTISFFPLTTVEQSLD